MGVNEDIIVAVWFVCFLMLCSSTLQKELSYKVRIFEKKVESYKTMTVKLKSTVDYIKVTFLKVCIWY